MKLQKKGWQNTFYAKDKRTQRNWKIKEIDNQIKLKHKKEKRNVGCVIKRPKKKRCVVVEPSCETAEPVYDLTLSI